MTTLRQIGYALSIYIFDSQGTTEITHVHTSKEGSTLLPFSALRQTKHGLTLYMRGKAKCLLN